MADRPDKVLVIPCSGVGKVHGLLSREAAYTAADELAPDTIDVVCLALLVSGDEAAVARVRSHQCVTIDGCGKACAQKNVEIAGGNVAGAVQVARTLTKHRGVQPGDGSELTEEGWQMAREIAEAVVDEAAAAGGEQVA
jgi:uncharacterized metal-binding protein